MPTKQPKRILVAPLDWGLGHTTRCVPIIRHILYSGHIPVFAGNEFQHSFIEETFDRIENIHLEGYNVAWPGRLLPFLTQIPGMLKTIQSEQAWLQLNAGKLNIHGIISDNRYGLFHGGIPSVILTHQLRVQAGMGNFLDNIIQKIHYYYLNRFNSVWVVDKDTGSGLAGNLSHSKDLPKDSEYIGLLTQFEEFRVNIMDTTGQYLLVLLSGPEPQRTIWSDILWQQLQNYQGKVIFVEGRYNTNRLRGFIPMHISYNERLAGRDLQPLIENAKIVICRSGYSTIMDLAALGKKAVLIPTPGQTEQEYLGKHLHRRKGFFCAKQDTLNIEAALKEVEQIPMDNPFQINDFNIFKSVLDTWLDGL